MASTDGRLSFLRDRGQFLRPLVRRIRDAGDRICSLGGQTMMTIRAIALWNKEGEVRRIDLEPGLNIITGESQTGKSTLIDIVSYCLGAKRIRIPAGPIASTVSYYGLLVRIGDTEAFLGRPGLTGAQSSRKAQLEIGLGDLPDFTDLEPNTNTDALRDWIGRSVGIEENRFDPPEGATRPPLVAKTSHALIHCFQRQDEIASRSVLFHRQAEDFVAQAIRDSLPYFLGVTGPDHLRGLAALRERRRELQRIDRAIRELAVFDESGVEEVRGLLSQAAEAGLIVADEPPERLIDAVALLRGVARQPVPAAPAQPQGEEYDRLLKERRQLGEELRALREQQRLATAITGGGEGAREEGIEQVVRLQQINVLPDSEGAEVCPICEQELVEAPPKVEQLRASLRSLEEQIEGVERDRPGLISVGEELDAKEGALRMRLEVNRSALDEVASAAEAVEEHQGRLDLGAWVRGRIDHFLESLSKSDENGTAEILDAERRIAAAEIDALEEQLDPDRVRDAATSALIQIGRPMSEMARRLGLEHSETGVRVDLGRLTVVADRPGGPIYMDTGIGSAKNWVGYHLATTLSLQEFFVNAGRPVPSFLMLDQPTQAFFPADRAEDEVGDQDRKDALAQFELMAEVIASLDDALQVIVLDHADFPEKWFQDSIRQRWRNGEALIPESWIDAVAEAKDDV
jgi:hypothetical protein